MVNISEFFINNRAVIIILILVIPIGFGIWWFNRRKSPKRELSALLITEDLRIKPISLPVELGYIVSHKWGQAWLIDPGIMLRRRNTSQNWLLLDERDASPQGINARAEKRRQEFDQGDASSKEEKEFNRIGKQRGEEAITKVVVNQEKEKSNELLKTIALALVALFILVVVATMAVNKFRGG